MRRVDILTLQLKHSRGRFFTTEYKTPRGDMQRLNFKVSDIKAVHKDKISIKAYVPSWEGHAVLTFYTDLRGDMCYLASDRSKVELSGLGL